MNLEHPEHDFGNTPERAHEVIADMSESLALLDRLGFYVTDIRNKNELSQSDIEGVTNLVTLIRECHEAGISEDQILWGVAPEGPTMNGKHQIYFGDGSFLRTREKLFFEKSMAESAPWPEIGLASRKLRFTENNDVKEFEEGKKLSPELIEIILGALNAPDEDTGPPINEFSPNNGYEGAWRKLAEPLREHLESQGTKNLSRHFPKQLVQMVMLCDLIYKQNQADIAPKILEFGCGPSEAPYPPHEYESPLASRFMASRFRNGSLKFELSGVSADTEPEKEMSNYGLKTHRAMIEFYPRTRLNEAFRDSTEIRLPEDKYRFMAVDGYGSETLQDFSKALPEVAREIVESGPYDIIFEQNTNKSAANHALLLLRDKGIIISSMFIETKRPTRSANVEFVKD